MCSTPYGIRGLDTVVNDNYPERFKSVLNALRHQRFGHLGTQDALDLLCQGVLNALRHQRFGHTNKAGVIFPGELRAQRLTASEVWTPATDLRFGYWYSRAQRLTASEVWTRSRKLTMQLELNSKCSTPYGIRGLDTRSNYRRSRRDCVLNALRHQRFGHLV